MRFHPGRPPKATGEEIGELRVKPLATRRAKILMIETIRDLAIEELEFAQAVHPVLQEFLQTQGKSETRRLPGRGHPHRKVASSAQHDSGFGRCTVSQSHNLRYIGKIRAVVADGKSIAFVTEHADQLPTALYLGDGEDQQTDSSGIAMQRRFAGPNQ